MKPPPATATSTPHHISPNVSDRPKQANLKCFVTVQPVANQVQAKLVVWRSWLRDFPSFSLVGLFLSLYTAFSRRETTASSTARTPTQSQSQHDSRTRLSPDVLCKTLIAMIPKYPAAKLSHETRGVCAIDSEAISHTIHRNPSPINKHLARTHFGEITITYLQPLNDFSLSRLFPNNN